MLARSCRTPMVASTSGSCNQKSLTSQARRIAVAPPCGSSVFALLARSRVRRGTSQVPCLLTRLPDDCGSSQFLRPVCCVVWSTTHRTGLGVPQMLLFAVRRKRDLLYGRSVLARVSHQGRPNAYRRGRRRAIKRTQARPCTPLRRSPDGAQSPRFFGQMRELFGAARDITRIFPHCLFSLA
jgi:hypothetical protein